MTEEGRSLGLQDQARIAAQVGAVAFVLHWLIVPRKSHQPRTLSPKTELSLVDCICMARELQRAWHGGSDPVSGHDTLNTGKRWQRKRTPNQSIALEMDIFGG